MTAKKPNLVNAVRHSEFYPEFEVPPHMDRFSLRPGDIAKVCVSLEGDPTFSGERFWVLILTSKQGAYTGIVDNELAYTHLHGLKHGDLVAFDYRHIYDFERGSFKDRNP